MIISRAPKSFRWFYGVSLACGAMCLILAIGGRTIAAGVFGAAAGLQPAGAGCADRRDARLAAGDHRPVERGASRPRGRWRQTAQTSRGVSESPRSLVCERRGDSVGWVEVI